MAYTFAGEYFDALEDASTGKPVPGVAVTVYATGTTTKATLYTDRTKATATSNPTSTSVEGNLQFFTDPGRYDLLVNGRTIGPVTIYPDVADVEDVTTLLNQLAAKVDTAGSGLTKTGTTLAADFGTAAGKVTQGNDSRLSDARTPVAHAHAEADVTSLTTDLGSKVDTAGTGLVKSGTTLRRASAGSTFANLAALPSAAANPGRLERTADAGVYESDGASWLVIRDPTGTYALGLISTTVKTSAYAAAANDLVPVDTTAGNVTVTLPTAPADNSRIAVKHVIQGGTHTVSVACGGSDVFNKTGGSTTLTLTLVNQAVSLQYKASSAIWYVVGDDMPLGGLDGRFLKIVEAPLRLSDYAAYASGDDWGPALNQMALDMKGVPKSRARIDYVPGMAQRYIRTPVTVSMGQQQTTAGSAAVDIIIEGEGHKSSLWVAMTDPTKDAITISSTDSVKLRDLLIRGTVLTNTDAHSTIKFDTVRQAHLEDLHFYGIGSNTTDGAVVQHTKSGLIIETIGFHGCSVGSTGVPQSGLIRGDQWIGLHVNDMLSTDFGIIDGERCNKSGLYAGYAAIVLLEPITETTTQAVTYSQGLVQIRNWRMDEGFGRALYAKSVTNRIKRILVEGAMVDGPSGGNTTANEGFHVENCEMFTARHVRFGISQNFSHKGVNLVNVGEAELDDIDPWAYPGDGNGVGYGQIHADSATRFVRVRRSPHMDTNHAGFVPARAEVQTNGVPSSLQTPTWATATRPPTGPLRNVGATGFNTDLDSLETWDGSLWKAGGPTGATGGAGLGFGTAFVPTSWYVAPQIGASQGTSQLANGIVWAVPFYVDAAAGVTLDDIGIEITANGSTGAVCRLGIRRDGDDPTYNHPPFPGTLLVDLGTIDTSTGVTSQLRNMTSAVFNGGSPLTLARGLWWIVLAAQGAPSPTLATYRIISGGFHPAIMRQATNSASTGNMAYQKTGVTGAFTTNWAQAPSVTSNAPQVFVHVQ